MKCSVLVLLALFVLLSACADREQQSPSAANRSVAAPPAAPPTAGGSAGVSAPSSAALAGESSPQEPPLGQSQTVYLDVRTPAEYAAGHVAGTLHIPLDQLEQRWQELASYSDRPIVVYCRTGNRSAAAIELLRNRGFDRLENGGGLTLMAARGLPMEPHDCC